MSHVSYLTEEQPTAPCTFYWTCSFTSSVIFHVTTLTFILCDFLLVFPDASRVDFSPVVYVCECVSFQYMHVEPKHAQVPFFKNRKPCFKDVSLQYSQQMSLLSGAGHVRWRVQSNLRWELKVAIKLYLCKSKQYNFTTWKMLVWPPSLPGHLVINFPPPIGPVSYRAQWWHGAFYLLLPKGTVFHLYFPKAL